MYWVYVHVLVGLRCGKKLPPWKQLGGDQQGGNGQ